MGAVGVKTMFLTAGLKEWAHFMISPPSACAKLGVMNPAEYWLAQKASYGLKESRKAWEETNDAMLL